MYPRPTNERMKYHQTLSHPVKRSDPVSLHPRSPSISMPLLPRGLLGLTGLNGNTNRQTVGRMDCRVKGVEMIRSTTLFVFVAVLPLLLPAHTEAAHQTKQATHCCLNHPANQQNPVMHSSYSCCSRFPCSSLSLLISIQICRTEGVFNIKIDHSISY